MHYKSIGMTGTRSGLSPAQRTFVLKWLENNSATVLHHGDCIGADDEVALMFSMAGSYIIAHPGGIPAMRANSEATDLILTPLNNLVRNRFIVKHSKHLLAFPESRGPTPNSQTWYTIEYAQKQNVPITIILPNGNISSIYKQEGRRENLRLVPEPKDS
jgi:hypothetical protein